MFSGSGDDSDTISSADSPVSADRQTRFSLKLLYFFSGAALLALLLSVFVQTSVLYVVFSAGVCAVFFFVWLWAVFEFDIAYRLKISASKAVFITTCVISLILEVVLVFLSGTSLVYASGVVLDIYRYSIELILSHISDTFTTLFIEQNELLSWIVAIVFGILSFVLIYAILKRLIAGRYSDIVKKEGLSSVLLFAFASALWVFVPLLPLYLTNINNVSLLFVLLLAVVYMIGTAAVYFISLFISRSALVSFGVCVIAWIGLSMSEGIITGLLSGIPFATVIYSAVLLGVMCLGGFGILKASQEFELSSKKLSKILIALVAVLLVINIIPIVAYNITSADAAVSDASEGMTFVVDDSLDHPNIYWIHAESMVGETVLEKYWGEDTVGFTDKLEERGFYVNHEAYVSAPPHTADVLPSLFSPTYYDSNAHYYPKDWYATDTVPNRDLCLETMTSNHEFISAFNNVGYNTVSVFNPNDLRYIKSPSQIIYYYDTNGVFVGVDQKDVSSIENLIYYDLVQQEGFVKYGAYPLYVLMSRLHVSEKLSDMYRNNLDRISIDYISDIEKQSILQDTYWLTHFGYSSFVSAISYTVDNTKNPTLTLMYGEFAHEGYSINENGSNLIEKSTPRLWDYYNQYLFSEQLILYIVDVILDADSNAVIIIQGDHGPHTLKKDNVNELVETFGEDVNPTEFWNHVLSAVRIPEQYQTEDYPEAIQNPRNIVRYLVNSYVGENYEYIPVEEA